MKEIAVFVGLIFLFVIVMLMPGGGGGKAERSAEKTICHELAAEVRAGAASRFDYMATRCAAKLLTDPQEE